jgi:type IV pilus assembly protein PilY1
VSAVNLDRSDGKAYLGYYNQRGWTGDLEQRNINPADAAISNTVNWQAATQINSASWSARLIFTAVGSAGVEFNNANVGATVNPDAAAFPDSNTVVNFLRGNRSGEGDTVRLRTSLMGPVVNAEPVLGPTADQTVYVASGEGMLHAINTTNGTERWAFVPPEMLTEVGKSVQRGWAYRTLLDATPALGKLQNGRRMLIGGLGAAGRAYYALDVTTPKSADIAAATAQYKWSFPVTATDKANMGYTTGRPVFARTKLDDGTLADVVLLTSGYDNGTTIGDGKGRVWMLDAATGAVLKSFITTAGTAGTAEAGLAHLSAYRESDGTVRYAYGGDLLGNVWSFDLRSTGVGVHTATHVAVLKDGSGNAQPVTSAPELMNIKGRRVALVGAGRLLDIGDFGSTSSRSVYAIATDGATITDVRTTLTARTYARGANPEVTGSAPNWTTGRGWYMDLPAGEEINTDPTVAYGAIVFVTTKNGGSNCAQQSYLYYIDATSGGVPAGSTDGSISALLSSEATSSRAVVLRDSSGRLHATSQLSDRNIRVKTLPLGDKIDPAKNAWREIRR